MSDQCSSEFLELWFLASIKMVSHAVTRLDWYVTMLCNMESLSKCIVLINDTQGMKINLDSGWLNPNI